MDLSELCSTQACTKSKISRRRSSFGSLPADGMGCRGTVGDLPADGRGYRGTVGGLPADRMGCRSTVGDLPADRMGCRGTVGDGASSMPVSGLRTGSGLVTTPAAQHGHHHCTMCVTPTESSSVVIL